MSTSLFDLTDKVALVTGGNGGIGFSIAKGLGQSGAKIIVGARNSDKSDEATKKLVDLGISATNLDIDVTQEESVNRAFIQISNTFKRLDILVNNAGIAIRKMPQEYTLEEWNTVLNTNLTGAHLCCQKAYPLMVQAGGGKIINIGSMTSIFGSDWVSPYAASKGGIVQLTKSLAIAWANEKIQVNSILPGWIHTELTKTYKTTRIKRYLEIKERIPQGSWGEPNDMAGTAIFLSSRASDYVTGTSIIVDGGYSIN